MALNPKQWRFQECIELLEHYMRVKGYKVRGSWLYRDPPAALRLGKEDSVHTKYLAKDIDLFDADGNYLGNTEDHREFGEFWKTLDSSARWGGDHDDGNHYSFEHEGNR